MSQSLYLTVPAVGDACAANRLDLPLRLIGGAEYVIELLTIITMHLILTTEDGSEQAIYESLSGWLTTEPDLRSVVALEKRPPREGELGSVVDALTIMAGSGGTLTVLAGALRAWLAQPRNKSVRIEIIDKPDGGRKIVLDASHTRTADIERILRTLADASDR